MQESRALAQPSEAAGAMSVAYLLPAWPARLAANGIATYGGWLVPAMRAQGVDARVIAQQVEADEADRDVCHLRVLESARPPGLLARAVERIRGGDVGRRQFVRGMLSALRRLRRERPLHVLEMEESFGWCGEVAARSGVAVVARLHGPWFLNGAWEAEENPAAFEYRVRHEGPALAMVDGVTAPSSDVLERTRRYYGMALEHAAVIPCPIGPCPPGARWDPERCEPWTVLFVGRFDWHKGGDVVIDAFRRVIAAEPRARLVFVGPTAHVRDADGRRWTCEEYIEHRFGAGAGRESVQWLGRLPTDRVAEWRRRAAVTVVASRYETFGYTAVEAAAMGAPIVCSAAGGLAEIIDDGRNGLACPADDPDALAAAVLRLLASPPLARRLGEQAAADCAARFSPGVIAARTRSYYEQVLRSRCHGAPGRRRPVRPWTRRRP
jgi:glycosyltransferase involved in cell wall biosynthesis